MKALVFICLGVFCVSFVESQLNYCIPKVGGVPFVEPNRKQPNQRCNDRYEECAGCNVESVCRNRCESNPSCYGYIWERDDYRCVMYLGCHQADGSIRYFEKNCDGKKSSAFEFRKDSSGGKNFGGNDICPAKCGDIPQIPYALHYGRSNRVGYEVEYKCIVGNFVNANNTKITCLDTLEWSDPKPKCDPMKKDEY